MLTKAEIIQTAQAQLARDFNCSLSAFTSPTNTLVENQLQAGRRIYDTDGCFFKMLCLGDKAIISADPAILPWCEERLCGVYAAWILEYQRLRVIDRKLGEFGHAIVDVHHYYLPNPSPARLAVDFDVRWYEAEEIAPFAGDERFQEAFVFASDRPDVLGVAALDGDCIMGMAGASADCDSLWQVGIDVLPEYRGRGIGTRLIRLLKDEILARGKVPFYGTVESHFHSQNIAINAGFFPVWAELYSGKMRAG